MKSLKKCGYGDCKSRKSIDVNRKGAYICKKHSKKLARGLEKTQNELDKGLHWDDFEKGFMKALDENKKG
jgi:hypothetical protein